jgi:hypothetical protein
MQGRSGNDVGIRLRSSATGGRNKKLDCTKLCAIISTYDTSKETGHPYLCVDHFTNRDMTKTGTVTVNFI